MTDGNDYGRDGVRPDEERKVMEMTMGETKKTPRKPAEGSKVRKRTWERQGRAGEDEVRR